MYCWILETCLWKHNVLFSNHLEYHILNSLLQDPTRHHASCQCTGSGSSLTNRSSSAMRAIRHIASGSNTLHSFMYSPSHIFALNIGASMRRTKHHSKVTSTSHFQMLFITTSRSCPNQKFYRNVQKLQPWEWPDYQANIFSESKVYMTNLDMVSWHQRTWISLDRNEPPKRIPQAALPKWTFHLVQDVYPQWTL